ncbi:MAG: VWA domain-containing protein [Bacilli bacterium]|nr:VWA domain-containing protein [Bacilli bacterium]
MELRYPFAIIIVVILFLGIIWIYRKKDNGYKDGSKIANTEYLKNTDYYKKKLREYKMIRNIVMGMFGIGIITSSLLIARLAKIETVNSSQYSRDIFLCMDVSTSVDQLNMELVDNLKKTVNKLHGERFGISIFNTSSVILVPLTDDYGYVMDTLDMIKKSIKANNPIEYGTYSGKDYTYVTSYIRSGTIENADVRGSSLIGDGLASCVYSFPKLKDEDRSRIIIFSTDNDLAGTPLVSLSKAASISKSKDIKVFGVGTKIMKNKDKREFEEAVTSTGGKFYQQSSNTVSNIVKDIEATSKTLLNNQVETKEIDIPEIPFILLMISVIGIIIMGKKVSR